MSNDQPNKPTAPAAARPMPLANHQMAVVIEPAAGSMLIRIGGDVDVEGESALRSILQGAIVDHELVELDLDDVTFMDSTGLKTILWARRLAAAQGRVVAVLSASACVRRLFDLTGVSRFLAIGPDEGVAN